MAPFRSQVQRKTALPSTIRRKVECLGQTDTEPIEKAALSDRTGTVDLKKAIDELILAREGEEGQQQPLAVDVLTQSGIRADHKVPPSLNPPDGLTISGASGRWGTLPEGGLDISRVDRSADEDADEEVDESAALLDSNGGLDS